METRKTLYLVGAAVNEVNGCKLPSIKQAFGYFLFLHYEEKMTVRDALRTAIRRIIRFWENSCIPTRHEQHCISKLEKVFEEWKGLKKHASRTSDSHKRREKEFTERLEYIFDIAHADAEKLIRYREDWEFLQMQRQKGRPGSMAGIDKVHQRQVENRSRREREEDKRKKRSVAEMQSLSETVALESSSSEDERQKEVEYCEPLPQQRRTKNIMTPGLAAALDRTHLSSRKATYLLAEVSTSLGHRVSDYNINRGSIHRQREKFRALRAQQLKSEFQGSDVLTVHWDGKLLEDLTSRKHVDRLPVLVSGSNTEQLLGVPKLHSGTAAEQTNAIEKCLDDWKLSDRVVAMCFDTTAVNTGIHGGTCVLLEGRLERKLLHFACRHYILELVLGAAFESTLNTISSGPEIPLFKRFRDCWNSIDQNKIQNFSTDAFAKTALAESRAELLKFASSQAPQARDDYQEFLNLSIIFLGGIPHNEIKIRAPGAIHRARWMAKVLYSIKIWLFRNQFKLKKTEEVGIRDFCIFSILVYLKPWTMATMPIEAPLNDWELMKALLQYPDKRISKCTSAKLSAHLWYLSEETVGFAFFDERLLTETKCKMVKALNIDSNDGSPNRACIPNATFLDNSKGLENLVTKKTKDFFAKLQLPTEFLLYHPNSWKSNMDYEKARTIVSKIAVVNDRAERAVALIQELNKKLTVKEEQLQFLLNVVADHRKRYPVPTKEALLKLEKN